MTTIELQQSDFDQYLNIIQAKGTTQGKADFLTYLETECSEAMDKRYAELSKSIRTIEATKLFNARKKAINDILADLRLPVRKGKGEAE